MNPFFSKNKSTCCSIKLNVKLRFDCKNNVCKPQRGMIQHSNWNRLQILT